MPHNLILFAFFIACVAVLWSVVLVDSGMLLEPVQRWVRETYRQPTAKQILMQHGSAATVRPGKEIDDQWWWKPLWGCIICCSGQAAAWLYWFMYAPDRWDITWHQWVGLFGYWLVFISLTILFASVVDKIYRWSRS